MLGTALKLLFNGTGRYLRYRVANRDAPQGASPATPSTPMRLDLGCGSVKREGFLGIDRRSFAGVDGVTDLTKARWVFQQPTLGGHALLPVTVDGARGFMLPDSCVAEAHCAHFLEHLEHNQRYPERVRFMNELWRVMVPGGTVTMITPHWASNRAYGDFTHADKPVSEMFYFYLDRAWRQRQAPDNDIQHNPDGYRCDFSSEIGYTVHPELQNKSLEEQGFATTWYKDAVMDLIAKLTARKN